MIFEQYHDYINYYKGVYNELTSFRNITTGWHFRYMQRQANKRSKRDYKQLKRYERIIKRQVNKKYKALKIDKAIYSYLIAEQLLFANYRAKIKVVKLENKAELAKFKADCAEKLAKMSQNGDKPGNKNADIMAKTKLNVDKNAKKGAKQQQDGKKRSSDM